MEQKPKQDGLPSGCAPAAPAATFLALHNNYSRTLPSGEPKFILLCCYRCLWARFHPTSLWLLSSLFLRHLFFFFFYLSLLPSH